MKRLLLSVWFVCAGSLFAVDIVQFYRPGDAETVNGRSADVSALTGDVWNFSVTTPFFQGGAENGVIYGGLISGWASSTDYNPALRFLGSDIQIQVNPGLMNTSLKGILCWVKEDFLNGADVQNVGFSSGDSMSIRFTTISTTTRSFRFVINQGGEWYVSDSAKTDTALESYSIDPSAGSWRKILIDQNYTIASSNTLVQLNDIRAVGVFMDLTRNGNQTNVKITDFRVSATPEGGSSSSRIKLIVIR